MKLHVSLISHMFKRFLRVLLRRWLFGAFMMLVWCAGIVPSPVSADDVQTLGTLTADRHTATWETVTGETITGEHSARGLETALRRSLDRHYTEYGLVADSITLPPESIVVTVPTVTTSHAEIVFDRAPATGADAAILWYVGHVANFGADDIRFADVFVFDAGCNIGGEILGSVIAVGSDVNLGRGATVRGDVIVIGGMLRQEPDSKIYGHVFAPGGHRRPRLNVPRADELEEEGYKWRPTVSYDRVDGLRPGVGARFQSQNAITRVGFWMGYALASETWQVRFDVRQRLLKSGLLTAAGSLFRLTDTDDDATVGRDENTAFAVLAGSDYRDYYGADGGEVSLMARYREVGTLTLAYRNLKYRWLGAERNLWHLFRPDHDFRTNFSTVGDEESIAGALDGTSSALCLTLGVAPVEAGSHPIGFNGSLQAVYEVAGGALGGNYDYDRLMLSGEGWWDSGRWHRFSMHAFYGTGRRDLPPNKLFYSGGIGTLRGYPQKIFVGDQSFVGNVEYHFTYWENP
ncbi:MAG: BamA/TamA family outer membrane protein, partial [Anaerolineales bacterium]